MATTTAVPSSFSLTSRHDYPCFPSPTSINIILYSAEFAQIPAIVSRVWEFLVQLTNTYEAELLTTVEDDPTL
jgi:hypothetical protein